MNLTDAVVLSALVLLLLYEGWALATARRPITETVRRASARWQVIVFLAGLMAGHFWFCECKL